MQYIWGIYNNNKKFKGKVIKKNYDEEFGSPVQMMVQVGNWKYNSRQQTKIYLKYQDRRWFEYWIKQHSNHK